MASGFSSRERFPVALVVVATLAVVVAGYRLFWFLTDDAFIAFRYVSNRQLGLGYVWNAAPFKAVEGYTSWLWVALLDAVWTVGGVEPPVAANWISLGFGLATLVLVFRLVERMELPEPLARFRITLLALTFLGIATNRTFLAWLSSGLETALFNFLVVLWVERAWSPGPAWRPGRVVGLTLAAALATLCRPDGMLLFAATLPLLALAPGPRPRLDASGLRGLACTLPLLLAPLHLIWRRLTYGEWLPNTYYAKYSAPWPASGWRYAASFVLEYAVWIWLAVALVWLARSRRLSIAGWIVALTLGAHLGYYTFVIGGDHFEYRVYSWSVPLLFVSFVRLLRDLELRPTRVVLLTALFVAASWPIPWTHWLETRGLETRRETAKLIRPVAQRFPPGLRFYPHAFDTVQAWLIDRLVCIRHQEHRVFQTWLATSLPTREEGARIGPAGRPVLQATAVGTSGWILPHVSVIDLLGLNDYVIARNSRRERPQREMGHDRRAPAGYRECFRPNVTLRLRTDDLPPGAPLVGHLPRTLGDEEIVRCETTFIERLAD